MKEISKKGFVKLNLDISIEFKIGHKLEKKYKKINFGKYKIICKESDVENNRLYLKFNDLFLEGQSMSSPEREGQIILAWLSVILKQKIQFCSSETAGFETKQDNSENIEFRSDIKFPTNIEDLYLKFKSLPFDESRGIKNKKLLERYVRACEVYQQAILLSNVHPNISFFLFVVSIECLSGQDYDFYQYLMNNLKGKKNVSKEKITKIYKGYKEKYGLKTNFIEFILSNYYDWKKEFSEIEFREFLSTIYNIRSDFTHSGENITKYIDFVDKKLRAKSFFTKIGKKELEFPGLNYISDIVRWVLVNYLNKQPITDDDNIPKLAIKDRTVYPKLTEAVLPGRIITKKQICYRE